MQIYYVNAQELLRKGTELLQARMLEEALSYFEQALLLDQKNADIWNKKGATLRSLGRYDEALECFNKALEIDPADRFAS